MIPIVCTLRVADVTPVPQIVRLILLLNFLAIEGVSAVHENVVLQVRAHLGQDPDVALKKFGNVVEPLVMQIGRHIVLEVDFEPIVVPVNVEAVHLVRIVELSEGIVGWKTLWLVLLVDDVQHVLVIGLVGNAHVFQALLVLPNSREQIAAALEDFSRRYRDLLHFCIVAN